MSRDRKPSEWQNVKRRITQTIRRSSLSKIIPQHFTEQPEALSPWDLSDGNWQVKPSDYTVIRPNHARYRGSEYGLASGVHTVRGGYISPLLLRPYILPIATGLFLLADFLLALWVLKLI